MVAGIVPVFFQGEPLSPFGRIGMYKATQVSRKTLINTFALVIRFRVVGCAVLMSKSVPANLKRFCHREPVKTRSLSETIMVGRP